MQARTLRTSAVLAVLTLGAACDHEAKLRDAQRQADERVAKAEREARIKLEDAQKQLQALKAELADAAAKAKAEAESAIQEAKANSDEQAKAAADALAKARAAYKAEARAKLAALQKDSREIVVQAGKAPEKARSTVKKIIQGLAEKQQAIEKDIQAFDSATLETLNKLKAKSDQDIAKLKSALKAARAKVP